MKLVLGIEALLVCGGIFFGLRGKISWRNTWLLLAGSALNILLEFLAAKIDDKPFLAELGSRLKLEPLDRASIFFHVLNYLGALGFGALIANLSKRVRGAKV
jgi:hypothetical protein